MLIKITCLSVSMNVLCESSEQCHCFEISTDLRVGLLAGLWRHFSQDSEELQLAPDSDDSDVRGHWDCVTLAASAHQSCGSHA